MFTGGVINKFKNMRITRKLLEKLLVLRRRKLQNIIRKIKHIRMQKKQRLSRQQDLIKLQQELDALKVVIMRKKLKSMYIVYCNLPRNYRIDPIALILVFLLTDLSSAPLSCFVYVSAAVIIRLPLLFLLSEEKKN